MDAADLIKRLKLQPHPEGGWYRETLRSAAAMLDGRAAATSILFLLEQGQRSHWHRVDAEELWIFQAGTPLKLRTNEGGETPSRRGWVLGRASAPAPGPHQRLAGGRGRSRLVPGSLRGDAGLPLRGL